jgi:hypothetical protein
MALDIILSHEIRNALQAAEHAETRALGAIGQTNSEFVRGYHAGHQAALLTIALNFGLVQQEDRPDSDAVISLQNHRVLPPDTDVAA